VTLISSLAADEEAAQMAIKPAKAAKPAPPPPPEPEPVVVPEPPAFEREEEAPAVIEPEPLAPAPPAFIPELIEADLVTPTTVEPVEFEPVAKLAEEPELEPPLPSRVILPRKKPAIFKEPPAVVEKKPQARQEMMQFEPVTRGRFEKSEPTIVEGQDLDVPTFLRKNVRVK
jgi:hypothetical protein